MTSSRRETGSIENTQPGGKLQSALSRTPTLSGVLGNKGLSIVIRHGIKKRWERLGVWEAERG